jgi:hypothetical protein
MLNVKSQLISDETATAFISNLDKTEIKTGNHSLGAINFDQTDFSCNTSIAKSNMCPL